MLTIKIATLQDIPLIRDLNFQVWPQTYTPILGEKQVSYMMDKFYDPTSLKAQMEEEGHTFIICHYNDDPVGFASFSEIEPTIFKLEKIYVLPGQQGRGTGSFMISSICDIIRTLGAQGLRLNVNRYNANAIAFYEKTGFTLFREEDIDIGNGYFMNDFVLSLAIR